MTILKANAKEKSIRLVGGKMPIWMHEYLTLYALAKKTTKSRIIQYVLENWIRGEREKENDQKLIEEVIKRVNEQRDEQKIPSPFGDYKTAVKQELLISGIKDSYINIIVLDMKDGKNKKT